LVAVEHGLQALPAAAGGLLRDADAAGATGYLDELLGVPWLLGGAADDAEATGARAGVGLLEFEAGAEDALAVADHDRQEAVAGLVEEQRVDPADLL
jgi:hypothetical protein